MHVTYHGPETMRANQSFRATLQITLEEAIRPGGRLAVAARHVSDFGDAQMDDPQAENYITVETSRAGVAWRVASQTLGYRHPWNRGFDLFLEEGALAPGDRVTVHLGGPGGFRGQSFVEERFRLRVGLQSEPEGEWLVTPEESSPGWAIVGQAPTAVRVRVPDVNAREGGSSVCIKLEDTYGNPASVDEPIEIDLLLDDRRRVKRVLLDAGMAEIDDVPLPADGAWHILTVVSADAHLFSRSNPFGPSLLEGYRLYWGEIHSQSGLCDGTNSPAYLYRYGRQAAGLDFASVSSHDMELTPEDWAEIQQVTKEAHRPGRYVTFLGYEWSGAVARGGDHNIYFLGDEGPLLYQGPVHTPAAWEPARDCVTETRTLAEVIVELGDRVEGAQPGVLVVPHCGGRICNLDYYDPRVMPVLEMHSCHRNYQAVAEESLRRGLRVGLIGGSDDHRGALGDSVPAARERFFSARNGLVAVYARELTRESLWEAIYARRVYATNGCRPALSFTANGVPMGGELRVALEDQLTLAFDVVVEGYFDRAELVRNTEVLHTFRGRENQIHRFSGAYTERALGGTLAYYLRVYQTDGGVAWASPIWVTASHAGSW